MRIFLRAALLYGGNMFESGAGKVNQSVVGMQLGGEWHIAECVRKNPSN